MLDHFSDDSSLFAVAVPIRVPFAAGYHAVKERLFVNFSHLFTFLPFGWYKSIITSIREKLTRICQLSFIAANYSLFIWPLRNGSTGKLLPALR